MRLSERSLQNPAAVAAAAAIVVLFGVLALLRLPIQLLPDTRRPELFVSASWREAAPAELEEALIEPIEEAMRGLPGLVEMRSESNRGQGGVGLTFEVGTDMTRVMLDVGVAPQHAAAAATRRRRAAGIRRRQFPDRQRRVAARAPDSRVTPFPTSRSSTSSSSRKWSSRAWRASPVCRV